MYQNTAYSRLLAAVRHLEKSEWIRNVQQDLGPNWGDSFNEMAIFQHQEMAANLRGYGARRALDRKVL
jgi:hypothetical protein